MSGFRNSFSPRRVGALITATAALAAFAVVLAPAAGAAGGIPSSTTVSASPANSTSGTAVTITAKVSVLNTGLGITPTGSVSFSSTNGSATDNLGTVALGTCLLSACTATLTTSLLPIGTTSVTASYAGDGVLAPSSASTPVTVAPNPTPGSSSTVVCYSGQPCDTGKVQSTDARTGLDVSAPPSGSTQVLSGSLGSGSLHCAGTFSGSLATFSSTATDVGKTVKYTGTGTLAAEMHQAYAAHTTYAGCFGSPQPFKGYTNGSYGAAPFNAADGLYEAALSNCTNNSGQKPCFTNTFVDVDGPGTGPDGTHDTDTYTVQTLPGDPKLIG